MCSFRLHFSDFNVLFSKKIKNLLQFTFEKITCFAKREKKITCHKKKYQPPPGYQMAPLRITELIGIIILEDNIKCLNLKQSTDSQ